MSSSRVHVSVWQFVEKGANSRNGDAAVLFNDPELIPPLLARGEATQLINSVRNPCHVMMSESKFDLEWEGRATPLHPPTAAPTHDFRNAIRCSLAFVRPPPLGSWQLAISIF